ncbi:hypothetical protein ACQP2P_42000 [Dactylosporangium sp. CA-139114]|uniref:pPIWI_RE_Y domain-containing protein n=1 Tax=Dactylosporangium sp. CA-139114 TaxID=3239931 RepID=UPI003D960E3D
MNEDEGTHLLQALAQAVIELHNVGRSGVISLPYPAHVQRIMDRIVRLCLDLGQRPPSGVPELINWCTQRGPGDWPFPVQPDLVRPDSVLVDPFSRTPSRTCFELAGTAADAARDLIRQLIEAADAPNSGRRARAFLVAHPVVVNGLTHQISGGIATWQRVRHLYQFVPPAHLKERQIAACPVCGLPSKMDRLKVVWCEAGLCDRVEEPLRYPATNGIQLLDERLRLFVTLPGRIELRLVEHLRAIGTDITLTDAVEGAYLLERPVLGKRVVHVADRIEPALLAVDAARWPDSLVVVPQQLFDRVPHYRQRFTNAASADADVALVSDDELVALVGGTETELDRA